MWRNRLYFLKLSLSQNTNSIKTTVMNLLTQFSRLQATDGNRLRPSTLSVMISSKKVPNHRKVRRKTNMVRSDPFAFDHHLEGNRILKFIRENLQVHFPPLLRNSNNVLVAVFRKRLSLEKYLYEIWQEFNTKTRSIKYIMVTIWINPSENINVMAVKFIWRPWRPYCKTRLFSPKIISSFSSFRL